MTSSKARRLGWAEVPDQMEPAKRGTAGQQIRVTRYWAVDVWNVERREKPSEDPFARHGPDLQDHFDFAIVKGSERVL